MRLGRLSFEVIPPWRPLRRVAITRPQTTESVTGGPLTVIWRGWCLRIWRLAIFWRLLP